jgi:PadR family transcriptional regulator PadR
LPLLKVLSVMLDHPSGTHYGLALSRRAELPTGTIYPILTRLEQAGWVESNWENVQPVDAGRPRRRLYRLTEDGTEKADNALEQGRRAIGPGQGRPRGWRGRGPREALT